MMKNPTPADIEFYTKHLNAWCQKYKVSADDEAKMLAFAKDKLNFQLDDWSWTDIANKVSAKFTK